MTTQTDVLAWLDSLHATDADGAVTNRKWPEAQAVRAAVAELIEAANAALEQDQVELPGWLTERLSAALANMGGQP